MSKAPRLAPQIQEKADVAMRYIASYRTELDGLRGERDKLTARIEWERDRADDEIRQVVRDGRHDEVKWVETRTAKTIATLDRSVEALDKVIARTQTKAKGYVQEYTRLTGVSVNL